MFAKFILGCTLCICLCANAQPLFPIKTSPADPAFKLLPLGEIKAGGWLKKQIEQNLNGFTGYLDSLAPDLLLKDDIYAAKRISAKVKSKDLGAKSDGGEWQVQFLWWNSETQGNWLDGLLRSAAVVNDTAMFNKAAFYVRHILASQDADGYLGIYDSALRYNFNNENGELWSKATILRFLLGWYELTKDSTVLAAIERAIDNLMKNWPINASNPFFSSNPDVSGLSHGIMIIDVLERLHSLTANEKYLAYGLFLYERFSASVLNEDAQLAKLLQFQLNLKGHGVHTYEHLRAVAFAYFASQHPTLKEALANFLRKIERTQTPSGGAAGDEFIAGRMADADDTGYEFCSLHELMHGYATLVQYAGKGLYGDKAERILFNAALGASHPESSSICYLKTDNVFQLTGGKHGDTLDKHQTRYRYSPVHREAAVCCVPNAGRIFPYYVQHMWMKTDQGLAATLLGPSKVETTVNNCRVSIEAVTEYPFSNKLNFNLEASQPVEFEIKIRKPKWVKGLTVSVPYTDMGDWINISKKWNEIDSVEVIYDFSPEVKTVGNNKVFVEPGPLVYCLPTAAEATVTRTFSFGSLKEINYHSSNRINYKVSLINPATIVSPNVIYMNMLNPQTEKWEKVRLVPMAGTILRRVTFDVEKLHKHP